MLEILQTSLQAKREAITVEAVPLELLAGKVE